MPKEVLYGYGKAKPYYFTTQLTLYGKGLRNSKNVTYVDVGLVQTCLDLIESWGWGGGGGGGGLSKNLVKPWA